MARISTYVIDGTIVDDDKVIGSDANNSMITKNYTVRDLTAYIGYSIGNNYFVPYNNASQNVDLGSYNLTANSIIIDNQLILNGTAGLAGQVLMSNGSGSPASWGYNIGSQDLQDVLNNGNTGSRNILLNDNLGSTIKLDVESNILPSTGIELYDIGSGNTSFWLTNKLSIQDGAQSSVHSVDRVRYSGAGGNIDIIANNYNNQTFVYPNYGGAFVMSVNGAFADMSGNVIIPIGTGTVTSVGVTSGTGISASVANPTTAPNITITNTAPDQVVSLASGTGIAITGTYPNFTIAATGSGSGITGSGTINYIPKWSSTSAITDSIIQQVGSDTIKIDTSGVLNSSFNLNVATGGNADIIGFQQNNIDRYQIAKDGANDFRILSYDNAGSYLGDAFKISANTLNITLPSLAGTGTRMVVASSTGVLSTQTIPTGGGGLQHSTASGTDTYTVTISGVTSYVDGDAYLIRFTNGNTTGCTLNINGLGAVTLYRNNDGALIGGDIISGGEMLCIYNSTLGGFQVIGTAPNTLLGYVTNADSVSITKGQVVYAFGGQGDRMTVKLASNTADATSARTVGVVLSTSIGINQKGLIMMQGLLDGLSILPTATYSDGDPIYLGATAGSITNVKPYAPNHLVYVATVTTASNGSAGRMYVNIQNGYELDELHNVQAQSPALKDTLWYDSGVTPGQWKTASISTILGYTPQVQLNGTGFVKASGTTISYDNSTYLTSVGTGVTNEITYWSGTNTIGSLTTATYPSLTELSYVKGVTSAIQTQINSKGSGTVTSVSALTLGTSGTDLSSSVATGTTTPVITLNVPTASASNRGVLSSTDWSTFNNKPSNNSVVLGYQGLGSTIKASPIGLNLSLNVAVSTALTTQRLHLMPVYLSAPTTITGVKWYQSAIGNYTANNYNGVGLYSVSGGTITLIASSTNDGTIWQTFATGTWGNKAFSSPVSNLAAGTYFIGALWNASATVTAPSIQTFTSSTASVQAFDFTGGRLASILATQLTLPSTLTLSTTTGVVTSFWLSLY